jgi:DNA-binding MarR family transcriptional regulator
MATLPTRLWPSYLSELQEKILEIVCTRESVTYKALIEETQRDRITVLQSVNSLIKQNYIVKQKEHPEHEKSKLSFKPTHSGKQLAAFKLKVSLEEILKAENDEEISKYFEIIRDVTDVSQRNEFIQPLEELLTRPVSPLFYKKGGKESILRRALKKGILNSVQNDSYDASRLLNERSSRPFKELLKPADVRELKNSLLNISNNLSKTIERLPNQI